MTLGTSQASFVEEEDSQKPLLNKVSALSDLSSEYDQERIESLRAEGFFNPEEQRLTEKLKMFIKHGNASSPHQLRRRSKKTPSN